MNSDRIASVISDLAAISDAARESFGGLTAEQVNWKADANSWSVAQCLEHLIVINSLYFPIFERMRTGAMPNTASETFSPFSGLFGRILINRLGPDQPKKIKTSKKAYPSASEIGGDIVDRFVDHNRDLAEHIAGIATDVAPTTIITSPLAGFVTYSLDDCLTILVVHERRHVLQAKRVMEAF
jgi:hypothetical protein